MTRRETFSRSRTRRYELVCLICGDLHWGTLERVNGRLALAALCPRCRTEIDADPTRGAEEPVRAPPTGGKSNTLQIERIGGREHEH